MNTVYKSRRGCGNCMRNNNSCNGDDKQNNCRLVICIAEHIAESDKIGRFAEVLLKLNMRVMVQKNGFQIVSV